jgi:hypothetical protein
MKEAATANREAAIAQIAAAARLRALPVTSSATWIEPPSPHPPPHPSPLPLPPKLSRGRPCSGPMAHSGEPRAPRSCVFRPARLVLRGLRRFPRRPKGQPAKRFWH